MSVIQGWLLHNFILFLSDYNKNFIFLLYGWSKHLFCYLIFHQHDDLKF